jgi:lipopolysaccharide export system protein LptA
MSPLLLAALVALPAVAAFASHAAWAEPAAPARLTPRSAEIGSGPEGLLSRFSFSTERGPISVQANQMEFDYRSRVLIYRGQVHVTQNDVTLESDLLRVELDPESAQPIEKIVAEGAVRIAKGERQRASGGRAVFDQKARTVTLSDKAVLRDGPNEVAGERVVVYLDEERSVVEGGQERVRAVLFPQKSGEDEAHPGE